MSTSHSGGNIQNTIILEEHDGRINAKKYVGVNLATQLDDTTTANVTYVGKAAIGSATSGALWQIQKINETTGMVITWADGNDSYDNVWDNRATLTYS